VSFPPCGWGMAAKMWCEQSARKCNLSSAVVIRIEGEWVVVDL
jgi:hypothetical protein